MMTPEERYHRDPMFRQLVDMMTHQIRQANYTPTELREAAILAAIHEHETRPPEARYFDETTGALIRPRQEQHDEHSCNCFLCRRAREPQDQRRAPGWGT